MLIDKYNDIISYITDDSLYNSWMNSITLITDEFANSNEENSNVALEHALPHTLRVAEATTSLLKDLNCSPDIISLGYVAGLLHDIGIIYGKKDHAKNSYLIAKDYIANFDLTDIEKEVILHAILFHGNANEIISPVDYCIAIADKCDYTRERKLSSKYETHNKINEIISNEIHIINNCLTIKYNVTDNFDNSALYIIPKTIDTPIDICKIINMNIEFYINNNLTNFDDRKDYHGYIYGN